MVFKPQVTIPRRNPQRLLPFNGNPPDKINIDNIIRFGYRNEYGCRPRHFTPKDINRWAYIHSVLPMSTCCSGSLIDRKKANRHLNMTLSKSERIYSKRLSICATRMQTVCRLSRAAGCFSSKLTLKKGGRKNEDRNSGERIQL